MSGGERGRARTCNRQLRRLMLYPIELLAQQRACSHCSGMRAYREWQSRNWHEFRRRRDLYCEEGYDRVERGGPVFLGGLRVVAEGFDVQADGEAFLGPVRSITAGRRMQSSMA